MTKQFYKINNGDVTTINPCLQDTDTDGTESIVVYADSVDHALELATAYDAGKYQPDNVWCQACGKAHAG